MISEVFIDGACRNNGIAGVPNNAACAVIVYENRKEILRFARPLGERTNNQAEYEALIHALLMCSMADIKDPVIYSDSSVVVNQVTGLWRCHSSSLFPFWKTVETIKEEYNFRLVHVPRHFVRLADKLCNECLDDLDQAKTSNT
jgi:ribonuclease HI